MLVKQTTLGTAKQIVLIFSATSGTILYTVPEGKTCVGSFFGQPSANSRFAINDITDIYLSTSAYPAVVVPATLVAGTVIKASGNSGYFIGVEQ